MVLVLRFGSVERPLPGLARVAAVMRCTIGADGSSDGQTEMVLVLFEGILLEILARSCLLRKGPLLDFINLQSIQRALLQSILSSC